MTEREFAWVEAHISDRPDALRLAVHGRSDGIDYEAAITQIECRRKFAAKLQQTLAAFPRFYFPSVLAGEQATSDLLAAYHCGMIPRRATVADLTAGLGIDVFHLATRADNVTAVELDHNRAEALRYNSEGLRLDNISVVEGDCADFVDRCIASGTHFDAVFIDPARRGADGSRVFALNGCQPDVCALIDKLRQMCRFLLIKASPMLDIAHTAGVLSVTPASIAAVGTPTECKELFVIIDFANQPDSPVIEAVTLWADGASTFAFTRAEEESAPMPAQGRTLQTGDYIYEAYPAVMKTGVFKLLASQYGLSVFHPNTRLYYSETAVEGFPGKRYRVIEALPYASKVIKRLKSRYPKAEVAVRNFGISADSLRSKLAIRDGGTVRIYGYTDHRGEPMLAIVEPA